MTHTLFIDGGAGTTGLEIRDRLAGRDEFELITLSEDRRKDDAARAEALNDADFAILCLPDDAARAAVAMVADGNTRIIDASTAHRTASGWTYGFPELRDGQADAIAAARFVANPGCYPTGFLALIAPLVAAGLLPGDWPYTVNAVSGYSGGGKALIERFEAEPELAFRSYAMTLAHKHLPEMQAHAQLAHMPLFAPAVAPAYRGMIVEVPLPVAAMPGAAPVDELLACLEAHYAASPLVTVEPAGDELLLTAKAEPTDRMCLSLAAGPFGEQVRAIAMLDNLGKGAGGAAVQNLNLMAGLDPMAGLRF